MSLRECVALIAVGSFRAYGSVPRTGSRALLGRRHWTYVARVTPFSSSRTIVVCQGSRPEKNNDKGEVSRDIGRRASLAVMCF